MNTFVHLHLHTEYSLLDGAVKVEELPKIIKAKGMNAVAITDHGVMYGVLEFYKACKREGVKPIIGCEAYVADDRFARDNKEERYHLILLAENEEGYHNLVKIISAGFTEGFYYKPRVDKKLLKQYSKGIIATSACMAGEIAAKIRQGNLERAKESAKEYEEIFGKGNFFIEIQNHSLPEEKPLSSDLIKVAKELDIPLVAANDSHYSHREDAYSHEVLMCIQMGKTIKDEHKIEFPNEEFYIKTPEEMQELFKDLPEAISNTVKIMERCNVEFSFNESRLPVYQVKEGETLESYLRQLCFEGAKEKYGLITKEIGDRLEYELSVINKMGYPGYFLIVWDMIKFAKGKGIYVGPGRGSAAGSIVAYTLDITTIDPLKYDLLFERFLNPERISLPDIDTDFCYVRRGEVIDYLVEKYGKNKVAQIITFGTMAARAAIRDVGRALDISLNEVDKVVKMIPNELKITISSALEKNPELKELTKKDDRIEELINIAKKLEGMPRHSSTHAAAVVISPSSLNNFIPIKIEGEGNLTTQFTMNAVEELGLLKMDLLGLRTLTVIGDTVKRIEENRGIVIDIDNIPLDNKSTYALLGTGKTSGLFQLESKGMQKIIKNLLPDSIEDIIALVALYRPGPIGSGMIEDFISRKHGEKKVVYLHPLLKPVLEDTYGVILYQEQVMRIAKDLAGFTLGEADNLRKAMGKKQPEYIEKSRQLFLDGCKDNNIDEKLSEEIFTLIEYFGGYGFNKSHSAAYGLLAYQTAYLKANYKEEFMSSLLSSVIMNSDKINQYIEECKKIDIKVMPPDVNESKEDFTVKKNIIRFGLGAIKNIGYNSISSIISAREQGLYEDIDDFCMRVDLRSTGKKVIENLIYAGAFDSLGYKRKGLLKSYEIAYDKGGSYQKNIGSNQVSLFDLEEVNIKNLESTAVGDEELDTKELLQKEKEMLGFYISKHPLDEFKELNNFGFKSIIDIEEEDDNKKIAIKGVVESLKEKRTKNNDMMAVMEVEDESGSLEVIVFPKVLEKSQQLLVKGEVVLIGGRMQITERDTKLIAENILTVEDAEGLNSYFIKEEAAIKAKPFQEERKFIEIIIGQEFDNINDLSELKKMILQNKGNIEVRLVINNKVYSLGKEFLVNKNDIFVENLKRYGEVKIYEDSSISGNL